MIGPLLCLLLCFQSGSFEANPEEVMQLRDQISALDRNLLRLQGRLDEMSEVSEKSSDEIGRLELQRALTLNKIDKFELELQEAAGKIEKNEARAVTLKARATEQEAWLQTRLRRLYKRGALGYSQLFLRQSELADLINGYHYARILTQRDQAALIGYRTTIQNLERVNRQLVEIRARAEETRENLRIQERNLAGLTEARKARLAEIHKEADDNRKLVQELELDKEELRMMIRRLTDEDTDPLQLQVPITRYRGKLDWPARGKILRRFGVYRDPEFGTSRRQNGLQLALPRGREVRGIYGGRVLYADWFKSYGNLVIINHNEDIVSFYAHCDRLLVSRGDFVERNQLIAFSGDTGSLDGPILHLEIRNQTKPEDPLSWLERRQAR